MTSVEYSAPTLRDFYYVLFRHKVTIIILFFSTIVTVFGGLYVWPETYEAKSMILIKLGRENVATPTISPVSQPQVIFTGLKKEDINSEIELIRNRSIAEKVVGTLGVDFLYPKSEKPKAFFKWIKFKLKRMALGLRGYVFEGLYFIDFMKRLTPYENAVEAVQKGLSAEQIKDSDVVEINLRWFNPDIATETLVRVIELYLESHLEAHKTSGDYKFFKQQVEVIGNRLSNSEDTLQKLKEDAGIVSYYDQRRLLLEQVTNFRSVLKKTQIEVVETVEKSAKLKSQLSTQPKTIQLSNVVNRNPIIDSLKMKLLELELEKRKLLEKYSDGSHPIKTVTDEIEKVKSRFKEEGENVIGATTTGANSVYEETKKNLMLQEVQLVAIKAKRAMLVKHISLNLSEMKKLGTNEFAVKRLKRQIEIDEENYLLYRRKLEELRVSDILDNESMVNVKVIAPASASYRPVKPKKILIAGLGFVLSLVLGIGVAFISEYVDHSIKTEEDVTQYLGLPLLASIWEEKR